MCTHSCVCVTEHMHTHLHLCASLHVCMGIHYVCMGVQGFTFNPFNASACKSLGLEDAQRCSLTVHFFAAITSTFIVSKYVFQSMCFKSMKSFRMSA